MTDRDLARLVERHEARVWTIVYGAASPELAERLGARVVPVGDGVALVGLGFPSLFYNRAFAFGLDRPVSEAELDGAISLYRDTGVPFAIQPCPMAEPESIGTWLAARGLPSRVSWVRWAREATRPAEAKTDLEIERVGTDAADTVLDLAFTIFKEPPQIRPLLAASFGLPGWSYYLVRDGDLPVGIGALYAADGVGWLGWGGTLASHRGRGAQSALIARRIRDGIAEGCRWLITETSDDLPEKPNPSFRNMARAGFRLLYRRASHEWLRPGSGAPSTG